MLPLWALCTIAHALMHGVASPHRAHAQPAQEVAEVSEGAPEDEHKGTSQPAPVPDEEKAKAEEPEPSYPIFDPEFRLIGGVERAREHPRASQIGSDNRQPFFLEQARVELDFEADKWLSGSISAELSDDPAVRDAFVNARIKRWFQVQAGHFKRPMSRIELTSTSKLPFRERGIFNRALLRQNEWGNRALGVMLWGKLRKPDLQWNLAATNSAESIGRNRPEQIRGVDVLGRIEWEPSENLSIAINGGYKNTEPYLNGPNRSLLAFGGDVRVRGGGFQLIIESIGAQNTRPPVPPDARGRSPFALGINGYATYDIELGQRAALQPMIAGEFVDTDLDLEEDEALRGVGGLNLLLFDGAYRVMPQVEIVRPLGEVSQRSYVKRETYYILLTAEL
jgi:hypothetical protein